MAKIEQLELRLVEKYRAIFDWDVPEIDQNVADKLILAEMRTAVRCAAALSKHLALPCAKCLRSRGAFFAATALRPARWQVHNGLTPHGSAAIAGFSPSLRYPWLGG